MCWGLAQADWAVPSTAQCPQEGKKVSESDSETPTPAAAPATVTDTVVSSSLMTNSATEAETKTYAGVTCPCTQAEEMYMKVTLQKRFSKSSQGEQGGWREWSRWRSRAITKAIFSAVTKAIPYSDNVFFLHACAGFNFWGISWYRNRWFDVLIKGEMREAGWQWSNTFYSCMHSSSVSRWYLDKL